VRWRRPVAPAADLDRPWREAEFCVLDLETTGLDLHSDAIISVGSVLVRQGRLVWSTRDYQPVRPDREISESAMRVHGLRAQDLATAPPIGEVADQLRQRLQGRVLVAHAAWVEQAFLGRAVPGPRRRRPVVDTAALMRATGVAPSGTGHEPDLEASAVVLGVCVHTPHHALGDALTTAEVFLSLVSRLERQTPGLTARSLVETSRRHAGA
jgi:DNA polymerase III subunit epsilon